MTWTASRLQFKMKYSAQRIAVSVQSYLDYQNIMFKIPHNSEISLNLSLQNSSDWPINAALGNAHMIVSLNLEGVMNIPTILYVLKGMHNIKTLKFRNTGMLECVYIDLTKIEVNGKLDLWQLRELTFEDIRECPNFYKTISRSINMKRIKKFKIASGTITTNK